jgi:hypothetical protein
MERFAKSDDEMQIVWGELYVPGVPDAQHDFMSHEQVRKAAYHWMRKGQTVCIDREHDLEKTDAYVVESFIARDNDPDFIPGSWVIGVHIPDPNDWAGVKKGEYNGFSLYGKAVRQNPIEMEIPSEVEGVTKAEHGHTHNFSVAYAPDGEVIGGVTDEVDGHFHVIRRGTLTETADGHAHQFDFVRGVMRDA